MKKIFFIKRKKHINESIGNGYAINNDYDNKNNQNIKSLTGLPYYSYEIIPLNHKLETKQPSVGYFNVLKIGNRVKGLVLNSKKETQFGTILGKVKNNDGNIKYYIIISEINGKKYKIDPTKIILLKNKPSKLHHGEKTKNIQYPRLKDYF